MTNEEFTVLIRLIRAEVNSGVMPTVSASRELVEAHERARQALIDPKTGFRTAAEMKQE